MGVKIHPLTDVQTGDIGEGTRIWQYAVVLPGAKIGRNCNICAHCFIENDVVIGDNVTVKPFVAICDGVTLEDGVFIGPQVSFTNDRHPKSGNRGFKLERTCVRRGATVGAGSMVMAGLTIGEGAMVAAGSVVTRDVPPGVTVFGCPAKPRQMA
ncbi:MAG: N-acetyltransferase [Kiritimatiellae bacterium]|nr:N-acetyltransferase [Kiritimatiellia bacterium]